MVSGVGSMTLGHLQKNSGLMTHAQIRYTQAVRSLNLLLQSKDAANQDATIMSAMLLGFKPHCKVYSSTRYGTSFPKPRKTTTSIAQRSTFVPTNQESSCKYWSDISLGIRGYTNSSIDDCSRSWVPC